MRRLFTPSVIKIIRELAGQGKTAREIAATIGSTAGSVRVRCCQLKIQLPRGRPSLVPGLPRHHEHKLVVSLGLENYAALKRKAAQMHQSPIEFAGKLLEAIVSANIFDAVLDDRDQSA
jgi:hypothetical protein